MSDIQILEAKAEKYLLLCKQKIRKKRKVLKTRVEIKGKFQAMDS